MRGRLLLSVTRLLLSVARLLLSVARLLLSVARLLRLLRLSVLRLLRLSVLRLLRLSVLRLLRLCWLRRLTKTLLLRRLETLLRIARLRGSGRTRSLRRRRGGSAACRTRDLRGGVPEHGLRRLSLWRCARLHRRHRPTARSARRSVHEHGRTTVRARPR